MNLDLALIGNCQIAGLLDRHARMVWACLPRFDGDPTFCALLAGEGEPDAGFHDVQLVNCVRSEQRYVPNTAIVETLLHDDSGGVVKIVDFAPRFQLNRRSFRPVTFVRLIMPMAGSPRLRIRVRPLGEYGAARPTL